MKRFVKLLHTQYPADVENPKPRHLTRGGSPADKKRIDECPASTQRCRTDRDRREQQNNGQEDTVNMAGNWWYRLTAEGPVCSASHNNGVTWIAFALRSPRLGSYFLVREISASTSTTVNFQACCRSPTQLHDIRLAGHSRSRRPG